MDLKTKEFIEEVKSLILIRDYMANNINTPEIDKQDINFFRNYIKKIDQKIISLTKSAAFVNNICKLDLDD